MQGHSADGKKFMGTQGIGVPHFTKRERKNTSGNQAFGGIDFGDISLEEAVEKRHRHTCLENRSITLSGK